MKLSQLRFFIKVVETGNITKAADALNVAQTAIGVQMRNLEAELQLKLLERHSRGVKPTQAGKLLYDRAQLILRQIDETRRDLAALREDRPPIRFGATPSILKLIGADLIVVARGALPGVELHVVEELSFLLVDALKRGDLDYILAYDIGDTPGLHRIPLLQEDLLHIAAPSFAAPDDVIPFRQALLGDLALVSERDVIWQTVCQMAERLSLPVNTSYWVQSMQGIKTLIQHGIAQSIMPYGIVAEQIRAGELSARRVVNPSMQLTLFLAYSDRKRPPEDEEKQFRIFIARIVDLLSAAIGPYAHPIA